MNLFRGQRFSELRCSLRIIGAALLFWTLAAGLTRAADEEAEPFVQIPERDEAQITRARAVTLTRSTLAAEVAAIATVVDRAVESAARLEAKRLVERYRGNPGALANAAAIAWVQKSPEQAVLLAAEAARAGPADANALNTLAALLAQAGYGHKAIPLLRHLAEIAPDDPTILCNLGVAWLNLGEVEEASKVLFRCLAVAPGHGVANLAAGIIAEHAGRRAEAVTHFRRATASNSSPLARQILKEQKQSYRSPKGFFGMLPKQEYFSPGAFEPVHAQKQLAEFGLKKAEKTAYAAELKKKMAEQQEIIVHETLKMGTEVASGNWTEYRSVYAKLDWDNYIEGLDEEGRLAQAHERLGQRMQAIGELELNLDRAPTPRRVGDPTPFCELRRPIAQEALGKMAVEYEKMVAETLFLWRDVTNARLTVLRFILPPAAYRASFAGNVTAYLAFVDKLNSELPLVRDPCAGQDLSRAGKFELALPGPGNCPFSLEVNAMVATLHMDCTSIGFDFKAGLAFSAKKDFTSGETTLTAGVGAKMDLAGIGDASGSGQMVLVWDAGNDLSFVGVEATAGAKISGIPGLAGTLAEDTFDLGREAGAAEEGPSVTAKGADLTKDLVKVGAETRLGVTIGPTGVDPSLSGEISGKLFGEKIFAINLP